MTQAINLPDCDISGDFTVQEISAMASLLLRRHGASATGVARYFALEHEAFRDAARARVWWRVEALLSR